MFSTRIVLVFFFHAIWLRGTTIYLQSEKKKMFNLTVAPDTYQG